MTTWAPAVLWKRKISRCSFCPFFTFEIIQYMLSANLVLWIFSSLCSDKDCHTWQHEMMARWEQLEEPFHPNFSNWSFAFLDFYKVWKWHILLLCTNFDATDEIKCNLFESFKGNLFLDFVTGGCLTLWESFPCHKIYHPRLGKVLKVVINSPLNMNFYFGGVFGGIAPPLKRQTIAITGKMY